MEDQEVGEAQEVAPHPTPTYVQKSIHFILLLANKTHWATWFSAQGRTSPRRACTLARSAAI
jgi:hypothetical protein